jgi:hypothetical protein
MISETYPEEYLDIDFLAKVLFDYVYISELKNCEYLAPLNYNKISISDIKLSLDKAKQKKLVNNIFNTKLEWLWRKRSNYLFKRPMNMYSTNVYLKIINKDDDQFDLNSNLNMNSLLTYLFSDLVINGQTKGILLNLMNVDIEFDLLEEFYSNYPEIADDFSEIQNKKDKVINITIFEHFFKMELLSKIILDLTWDQLKSIIFQVAHTLAVIQEKFNGYKHNNLFINELFVYIKKPKINTYKLGSKEIQMNDEGYEIKIGSFSKSYIPNIADNNGITEANKELNNISDLINFLEDIHKRLEDNIKKKKIEKIINNIKKNDKNILLSNIIMTNSFLNIQNGGKKSKERKIKGIRYLSNSDIFLKSNNKDINLADSLSSFSDESVKSDRYKFSEEAYNSNMSMQSNMGMGMQANMGTNMYPNMNMPMQANMYPNMGANMGMPMQANMYPNMAMDMNQMGMASNMSNQNITNNDLVKLGIMAPSMTSSLLKTSQMGGDKSTDDEYINLNGNFFF